jgi:S-DNA-T family DNA segregation ATPase FtsK/SpoIIIE
MSAADSSNLMDSPAASRLGGHTAIFYSEERGEAEKFRPYGVPGRRYLEWAAGRMGERGKCEGARVTE